MHRDITERTVAIALQSCSHPTRVLDIGCGTGLALRLLAERLPHAQRLVGVDAASEMVDVARERAGDGRIMVELGTAECLPVEAGSFELVISITSFDHWTDQAVGLRQCALALAPAGVFVLTDLFSPLLAPTMLIGRRGHARTKTAGVRLLRLAGFFEQTWHPGILIKTVVASTAG